MSIWRSAACLPIPGVTAHRALTKMAASVRARGSGCWSSARRAVGLFAIQLARALGAEVVGVCSARNAGVVSRFGATHAIDCAAGAPLAAARALGPLDLVLNAVGSETYPTAACRALLGPAPGALALVPVSPRDYPDVLLRRARVLLGRPSRARLEPLVDLMARGALEAVIAERVPLAEANRGTPSPAAAAWSASSCSRPLIVAVSPRAAASCATVTV